MRNCRYGERAIHNSIEMTGKSMLYDLPPSAENGSMLMFVNSFPLLFS